MWICFCILFFDWFFYIIFDYGEVEVCVGWLVDGNEIV